ncbi:unnamed protein product [Caenorhabditis brenneri]
MLKSFFLFSSIFIIVTVGHPPKCFLPLAQGTSSNCQNAPSQRYHFDPTMNQCHAFQYKGCGGNLNNYETLGECKDTCDVDLSSYVQCPLGTPPIFDSNDNSQCALTDSSSGEGCESNEAICINFNTIALCCNRTVHFGFQDDASATCPSGKARWQIDGNTVLAKSCDAVVCPSGYSCKDGNFFSYCCEN